MNKYSRYYGLILFVVIMIVAGFFAYKTLSTTWNDVQRIDSELVQKEQEYNQKLEQKKIIDKKLAQIKTSSESVQKKIYAPVDSDLGNDSLFFTLYNDVIEMVHANAIKIKSMEYTYNPEGDPFVKFSRDLYFVSEIELELVSNYTNLGKFIQEVVQYPYYIMIENIDVKPYAKDKKILLSDVKLKLYARTSPESNDTVADTESSQEVSE